MKKEKKEVLEGYFKKKGSKFSFWKKVYCTFNVGEKLLQTFKNEKDQKAGKVLKEIHITPEINIIVLSQEHPPQIIFQLPKSKKMVISNPDSDVITEWGRYLTNENEEDEMSMDMFNILSTIGRGSYGKVMLCENKETHELYAIKSIHKNRLVQTNKVYTVVRERVILSKTKHPFIVSLCFAFQTPTKFYIGLEYVPGGDLFHLMSSDQDLPFLQMRLYIAEIALAIDYLHQNKIIYRDLKPENVLIGLDGHLKLTDFGLAKDLEEDSKQTTTTLCGTPEYVPPEMIRKHEYGPEIDWWALGIIAYEIIFREVPFTVENNNISALYDLILNTEPDYPQCHKVILSFLKGLLQKDPKKRFTFSDIKMHSFWKDFDWDKCYNKEYQPFYIPQINNIKKPDNFDPVFTKEIAQESIATPVSDTFKGFSFAGIDNIPENEEDSKIVYDNPDSATFAPTEMKF